MENLSCCDMRKTANLTFLEGEYHCFSNIVQALVKLPSTEALENIMTWMTE